MPAGSAESAQSAESAESAASDAPPLHLSPSLNHQHLRERLRPELAYTDGPVRPWQERLRPRLREQLGLPDPERPPLAVRTLWSREVPPGTVDKVAFTAESYADVVAYFCVPRGLRPPYPTVICLQGHGVGMHDSIARRPDDEVTPHLVMDDGDFAVTAMRHGFAALCVEQRAFGERSEREQASASAHGCHDAAVQALMLGRTLVGERVFDVDRGIDYLAERGDVDLDRVGVMGHSGGGTAAIYAAALLDRVRFAMPSCAFCTYADSIMSVHHCLDNYVPGVLRYAEQADVLGLFAPKPVVVVAGRDDTIFPLAGVEVAYERLRDIYAAAGAPDRCRLVVGDGGHRFFAAAGWAALRDLVDG